MLINYAWVFAGVLACASECAVLACEPSVTATIVRRTMLIKRKTNQNILGCGGSLSKSWFSRVVECAQHVELATLYIYGA